MLPKSLNKNKHELMGPEPTIRVWVNGVFDVLHYGHIHLFQYAKNLYPHSHLCVGIDSDERVSEMKGKKRPINDLHHRTEFLKSIRYIDEVTTFGSDDELRVKIRDYSPHIMCIGAEYRDRTIVGEEFIPRVIYVEKYNDLSTTKIVGNG